MIKNIIFDWSGVINDNRDTSYLVILEMLKKFNVAPITMEKFRTEWEQPYMIFYNKFIPNLTLEEETKVYKEIYTNFAKDHQPFPYPKMVDMLKKFKHNGIKLIIISSDHPEHLFKEISDFGLNGVFDEINSNVHDKSEDLVDTIQRNNFNPQETIFIGDTQHEIDAGKSANLITGAVTWGIHSRSRLESAKPDYIIDSPDELAELVFGKMNLI